MNVLKMVWLMVYGNNSRNLRFTALNISLETLANINQNLRNLRFMALNISLETLTNINKN
jgi:hypothetical protein